MELDDIDTSRPRATLDDDRAYTALVTDPPAGASGLWVTIPEIGHHKHGPCRGTVPEVAPAGTRCLVIRADGRGDWWVIAFDI